MCIDYDFDTFQVHYVTSNRMNIVYMIYAYTRLMVFIKIIKNIIFVLKYCSYRIPRPKKHIFRLINNILMMIWDQYMTKSEIGGHLGRHLEFIKRPRVDSWGLLVCCRE